MISVIQTLQLEGTWEEILHRGTDLAGRRVRVTVLPSETPESPKDVGKTLDQILAPLIAQAATVRKNSNPPQLHGLAEEFASGITEQLKKQGIKI